MTDERDLVVRALTGLNTPDNYTLGKTLETVLDERDEAWKDSDESGDRITKLEDCLVACWKLLSTCYLLKLVPEATHVTITDNIAEIERLLQ